MLLKDIIRACRMAMRGNKSALDELGLSNITYQHGKPIGTGRMTLQTAYCASLNTAVAARELSRSYLERQCQMTMGLVQTIAQAQKIDLEHEIDPEDVAEIMLALTDEEQARSNNPSACQSEDKIEDENAMPRQEASGDIGLHNQMDSTAAQYQPENKAPSPKHAPPPEGKSMAPSACQSEEEVEDATPSHYKGLDKKMDSSTAKHQPDKKNPKPTPPPEIVVTDQQSDTNQGTEQVKPSTDAASRKGTDDEPKVAYKSSTDKNKRRQCPVCPFFGTHITRHMQTRHPEHCESKAKVARLVHFKNKVDSPRTSPRPEKLYQCNYRNCTAIVKRMGQHLQRFHRLTDPAKITEAKSKFRRIGGLGKRKLSQTKLPSKATPQPKKAKISEADLTEEVVQLSQEIPVAKPKPKKAKVVQLSQEIPVAKPKPKKAKVAQLSQEIPVAKPKPKKAKVVQLSQEIPVAKPKPKKAKVSAPNLTEEVVQLSQEIPVVKGPSMKRRKQSKIIREEDDWSSTDESEETLSQVTPDSPVVKDRSMKRRKQSKIIIEEDDSSSTDESEGSFHSGGSTTDEHREYDEHELKVEADLDDICSVEEDEENIEDGDQQNWKDYYLSPPKNDRHYFMSQFYRYLLHAEGGAHSEHQALLYTRQVHIVADALDAEGTDLSSLTDNDGLNIWDNFCVPRLQKKILTGNSLKVYLRSLEYFVKFIKKGLLYDKERLPDQQKEVLLSLRDRLPDYRSTIHRRTGHQETTRKVDECFTRITPADLRKVEASSSAQSAVKFIGCAADDYQLSSKEFVTVRDYLLVTTLYQNGSRPGPLENATIGRFKQAQYVESSRRWTIIVDKHKTTRHHGPAELAVDDRLYGYLKIYVECIRPNFAAKGEDALFVKDDGFQFAAGTIGRRVGEFFSQAGVRTDIRVTATNIRKLFSDKAFALSPKKKRLINNHMKHHERTADANYVLNLNSSRAASAHQLMSSIINEEQLPSCQAPEKASCASEETCAYQNSCASEEIRVCSLEEKKSQEKDQEDPAGDENESQGHSVISKEYPAKETLSDDDKVVILTVFKDKIEKGQLLTLNEVRMAMRTDLYLRPMVVKPDAVKKIADFVRYKTNFVRQTQLTEMTEPDEFDFVASLSLGSGLRRQWSTHDTTAIEGRFGSRPKITNKKEIIRIFNADQVLSHIVEREGHARCYEKVKSFYKRTGM